MGTTVTDASTRFHASSVPRLIQQDTTAVPLLLVVYVADPAAIPYLGVWTAKAPTTPTQHNAPPTPRLLKMRTQKRRTWPLDGYDLCYDYQVDFCSTLEFVKEDGDGVSFVIFMVFLGHTLGCMPEFSCSLIRNKLTGFYKKNCISSAVDEREPCATVKCNSGCATPVPRLLVIECDIV